MPDVLLWPLRVGRDGRLVTVEQHDPADVVSCVTAVAATPQGWDFAQPEFGMSRDGLFRQGGVDADRIVADVRRFEPRADPSVIIDAVSDMLTQGVIVDPAGEAF